MKFIYINDTVHYKENNKDLLLELIQEHIGNWPCFIHVLSSPVSVIVREDFQTLTINDTAMDYINKVGIKVSDVIRGPVLITGALHSGRFDNVPDNYFI